MLVEKIPAVYGRALLEAADDKGSLAEVAEEVESLRKVLDDNPDLRVFIESPRLETSKKRAVVERSLRGRASDILVNFVLLLIDKGRESLLRDLLAAFSNLHDQHIGLVRARVVSAVPLAGELVSRLRDAMEAQLDRKVVFENEVDPGILGGLIVRFDGMVADGSIKTALDDIRANMLSRKFGSELVHEN